MTRCGWRSASLQADGLIPKSIGGPLERTEMVCVPSSIGYRTVERFDCVRRLCEQRSATEKEQYHDVDKNYSTIRHFFLVLNVISRPLWAAFGKKR